MAGYAHALSFFLLMLPHMQQINRRYSPAFYRLQVTHFLSYPIFKQPHKYVWLHKMHAKFYACIVATNNAVNNVNHAHTFGCRELALGRRGNATLGSICLKHK